MAFPISLPSLPQREAIVDALHRATIGIDTNDVALFDSAWINKDDAIFEMNGTATQGLDAIHSSIFARIGPMDTTHFTSNFRINAQEGADTASFSAYALNQHYREGEGMVPDAKRLLAGSMYWVDVTKEANTGLWKMKKWSLKLIWVEGDLSIVMPSES